MKHSPNFQNAKKDSSIDYQLLFKLNTDAIFIIDHSGEIHHGNAASENISGYSINELRNQSILTLIENKEHAKAHFQDILSGLMTETRIQLLQRSGNMINCLVKCIPLDVSDFKKGFFLIFKDMSLYDSLDSKFRETELNFQIIAENVQDVIILMNEQREYLYVSPSSKNMFGVENKTVEKLLQNNSFFYNHPDDTELLERSYIDAKKTGKPFRIVIKILHKEKGWVYAEVKGTPVYDDDNKFRQMVLVVSDISAQKEKLDRLEFYAYHDPLTGLPNRRYFEKRLRESIEKLNIKGQIFTLILFDIDDFKKINDSWGHEIGDQVIQEVANRTQQVIEHGIAARLGGDEFIVLLYNCMEVEEVKTVIHKLQKEISRDIVAGRNTIAITNSIGATICRNKYKSETYYFKSADVALYEVKQKGKNQYQINYS
ncbi:sensor domain-containing diguanylate cyclase [Ureibacillus sinduriensis]|uniref:sensor domain-containing diguanylate cyclase n=1 Tax=Ureibacillus sinduriensis TaxID=561440 RepID=UPI00068B619C|nr:sensor domain-containing diguanylate cyclase [Ureibacillus sinduriensis]